MKSFLHDTGYFIGMAIGWALACLVIGILAHLATRVVLLGWRLA